MHTLIGACKIAAIIIIMNEGIFSSCSKKVKVHKSALISGMVHLHLHVVLLLCTEALRMFPVTFEKDEGMHIDFIAAASVSHFMEVVQTWLL